MSVDTSTAAVTALMQGVTDGPWVTQRDPAHFDTESIIIGVGSVVANSCAGYPAIEADSRFIAAARDLVPALLAERDAKDNDITLLRAERDGLGSLLLSVQHDCIKEHNRTKAAEAKVEKLVEALRRINIITETSFPGATSTIDVTEIQRIVRTAIFEIEGEK